MDEELFYSWFSKLFVPQTNHLGKQILIINRHGSHMSSKLIDSAIENDFILYRLPPHTTHLLQPLDISVYKPLKNNFSTITDFIVLASVPHGPTKIMVNKTNFPILFKEAFEKTMSMKMIISGFRISGICPFNPEAILKERLMPSDDATGIVNQVQQDTPSDKSTQQNQAITPATSQGFLTLPRTCLNPLVSTGLISPDLAEILQPVKHDEKIKPPSVIIEECVLKEDDCREKIAAKHKEKNQKELHLKLFRERKEIRKSEAAAKANKKAKETSTIARPVDPTKSAEETIQQPPNTVPLIASLKTKTEEPASTFSALTNITISIPEQGRSNPKCNRKKNFVLDKLVFSSSDSSSASVSEEESVAWYCRKCYKETPPGHLNVNYNNWIESDICKQWYHAICENVDPDSYINREFKCSHCK